MSSWNGFNRRDGMVEAGNRFTEQFPTVAEACEHLPPDTLLDAEKEMVNSGLVSSEERTAVRIRWSLGYVAGCRW
jgi:hypothetical protein